eukprot:Amastigsp_a516625_6.p3 type:complete len:135 gc:universal Amastigsp_a516625_6:196-600(+)
MLASLVPKTQSQTEPRASRRSAGASVARGTLSLRPGVAGYARSMRIARAPWLLRRVCATTRTQAPMTHLRYALFLTLAWRAAAPRASPATCAKTAPQASFQTLVVCASDVQHPPRVLLHPSSSFSLLPHCRALQ